MIHCSTVPKASRFLVVVELAGSILEGFTVTMSEGKFLIAILLGSSAGRSIVWGSFSITVFACWDPTTCF